MINIQCLALAMALAMILCLPRPALAWSLDSYVDKWRAETPDLPTGAGFTWDNDAISVTSVNTDSNYSNGARLQVLYSSRPFVQMLDGTKRYMTERENGQAVSVPAYQSAWGARRMVYGFFVNQGIYTPKNLKTDEIQHDDRPYAGWLQLGFFAERAISPGENGNGGYGALLERHEFSAGCIGPCSGAADTQKTWHSQVAVGSAIPKGWRNQVTDELTLQYSYERQRIALRADGNDSSADLTTLWGVDLGNVLLRADVGLMARLGFIGGLGHIGGLQTPFGSGGASGNGGKTGEVPIITHYALTPPKVEFFLFGRVEGAAVGYNALLQGGVFNRTSPYTVKPSPFLLEMEYGVVLGVEGVWVTASFSARSSEFDGDQWSPTRYRYGRVSVTWNRF